MCVCVCRRWLSLKEGGGLGVKERTGWEMFSKLRIAGGFDLTLLPSSPSESRLLGRFLNPHLFCSLIEFYNLDGMIHAVFRF